MAHDHDHPPSSVTALLAALRSGDGAAEGQLYELLYDEMRELAAKVRRGRASETMNATALVSEAFLKLQGGPLVAADRGHFLAIAARAMRQILVDEARRRSAAKRGGGEVWSVTLHEGAEAAPVRADTLIALDEALDRLSALDPRAAQVVEQRFFVGMSIEDTATALGVGTATVERDWRAARAWLARELGA